MTSPQWTVDDNGRPSFPVPGSEPLVVMPWPMRLDWGNAYFPPEAHAALVADVAAARLVDDMAALLREIVEIDDRFGAHTKECITDPNDACGLCLELAAEQSHSIEAAREVAALHHARTEKGT